MLSRAAGLLFVLLAIVPVSALAQGRPVGPGDVVLSEGYAGVYPDVLRGRVTASGATYDPDRLSASHRTLPLGMLVRVIREETGENVVVRIIDRGPYTGERVMDLSDAAAETLGIREGRESFVSVVRIVNADMADDDRGISDRETMRGGFTIQLGSYASEVAAMNARGRAESAWVHAVDVDGQTFYRLNFGRYESRDAAAADLEWLETNGFFGFVKSLPQGA